MRVHHRRADVGMAEELLDRANVRPAFEQVCGERVPKGMAPDSLREPRLASRLRHRPLHHRLVQVKPGGRTKPLITADPPGGKDELPRPVGTRIRVLAIEGPR